MSNLEQTHPSGESCPSTVNYHQLICAITTVWKAIPPFNQPKFFRIVGNKVKKKKILPINPCHAV